MSEQSQYRIIYLAPAQRDLLRFRDFLVDRGVAVQRAQEIIREIVISLRILTNNPRIGFSMGGKYGFHTPYRGLVCGKYVAVYEVFDPLSGVARDDINNTGGTEGYIEIRRIYHIREDHINQLMTGIV